MAPIEIDWDHSLAVQTSKQTSFTPFGMGIHFCAGYELARVELLIFLHHFALKFRYKSCLASQSLYQNDEFSLMRIFGMFRRETMCTGSFVVICNIQALQIQFPCL